MIDLVCGQTATGHRVLESVGAGWRACFWRGRAVVVRVSLMRVMMVCLEEEWAHVVDGIPRDVAVMSRGNDQWLFHGDVTGHS